MKRFLSILLSATMLLGCLTMPSCDFAGHTGDTSSVVEEEEKFFYHDEEGKITATTENTTMLGRTVSTIFRSYDPETEITEKRTDVLCFNWPASGFEVTFVGTGLEVELCSKPGCQESTGSHVFLYVIIDGQDDPDTCSVLELDQSIGWYTVCEGLEYGTHTAKLIRKNANDMGGGSLTGVDAYRVQGENGYMTNPPKLRERKIEVFGDSITCGDELFDNGDGTTSSDGWRTYAAHVAREMDAELNVIAISGNGLICSLFGSKLYEIPDRFKWTDEYNGGKDEWDYSQYQAGVVLINLGTNDCTGVPNNYSYEQFEQAYVDFCTEIKTAYPDCIIIAMLGMMGGRGKVWPSIEKAAKRINDTYGEGTMFTLWLEIEGISDSPVQGGSHPSIEAQKLAGEKVIEIIEANTDWKRN